MDTENTDGITYDEEITTLNYQDISFSILNTESLTAFPLNTDEDTQWDAKDDFFDQMRELIKPLQRKDLLKVDIYFKRPKNHQLYEPNIGIFYFKGKTIIPILFQDSHSWTTWYNEMTEGYDDMVLSTISESSMSGTAIRGFNNGDPYQNTGSWIVSGAPKDYFKEELTKEKEVYLKKYININSASFDKKALQKTFLELITKNKFQITPSSNNEQIYKKFETLTNYAFPEELKTIYEHSNGLQKFVNHTEFLSAQMVLQEWINWSDIYTDWTLEDLTGNNQSDSGKTLGLYTTPYWVPFIHDGAGNFLAIDYLPGSQGTSGQIIAFGADENKIRFIAPNMQNFIQQLLDDKNALNNGFN